MRYYNFSLLKDFNQMKEKRTEAVFGLDLMNFEPLLKDRNLRVFAEWWCDNPEEKIVVQLLRDANFPNKTRYILRIPYDEIRDTIYLFRILVKNQSNKVVEKSSINTIRPAIEGIIPPDTEEEIKELGGYEYVQGLLNMIAQTQNQVTEILDRAEILEGNIEEAIRDWAAHADLDIETHKIIDERIEYKTGVMKEELIEYLNIYAQENLYESLRLYLQNFCEEKLSEARTELEKSNSQLIADSMYTILQNNRQAQEDMKLELREQINSDTDVKIAEILTTLDNILGRLVNNNNNNNNNGRLVEDDSNDK